MPPKNSTAPPKIRTFTPRNRENYTSQPQGSLGRKPISQERMGRSARASIGARRHDPWPNLPEELQAKRRPEVLHLRSEPEMDQMIVFAETC
jgi:hypothetical protein